MDYNGCQREIDKLLYVRQDYAYGKQNNYLDHSNCIGFTRMGDEKHPEGCAVIMSNGDEGSKKMYVGKLHAGEVYSDLMENREEEIMIDEEGHATFTVNAESLSVWIKK